MRKICKIAFIFKQTLLLQKNYHCDNICLRCENIIMSKIIADEQILEQYRRMSCFLAGALGEDYEIVLHEIKGDESRIVEILNSHISGRTKDSPLTDLALKVIKNREYEKNDYRINYTGVSNGKKLISSTFFIKNSRDELIGMLCINYDPTKACEFIKDYSIRLSHILRVPTSMWQSANTAAQPEAIENLSHSVSDVIKITIDSALKRFSSTIDRLTFEEKLLIIQELEEHNIFILKGAVAETAAQLHTSIASVYRYLNKIKEGREENFETITDN